MLPEVSRGFQRFPEGSRGFQRLSEVSRGFQRFTEVSRGLQRFAEVYRGLQLQLSPPPMSPLGVIPDSITGFHPENNQIF